MVIDDFLLVEQGHFREPEFRAVLLPGEGHQPVGPGAVSYTHLDVYKRQTSGIPSCRF